MGPHCGESGFTWADQMKEVQSVKFCSHKKVNPWRIKVNLSQSCVLSQAEENKVLEKLQAHLTLWKCFCLSAVQEIFDLTSY